jgi:putative colanic acid biosynthesis UDP-glucose lipid carrier transferase
VRQKRHDLNGQLIELHMFRTTYIGQGDDQAESVPAGRRARPTVFGRILRQSSLDELPQFIDILMGTMSSSDQALHAVARG